jgi:UDP-glucose 4-epimerase
MSDFILVIGAAGYIGSHACKAYSVYSALVIN